MAPRYLLVCRGPNCKAQGSVEVREALRRAVGQSGQDEVLVLPYTCFDRCGRGPNAVLYPDGDWFEALRLEDVPDLLDHVRGKSRAAHLLAEVDERHAEEYYRILDEVIPELEAEAIRDRAPRHRGWGAVVNFFTRGSLKG